MLIKQMRIVMGLEMVVIIKFGAVMTAWKEQKYAMGILKVVPSLRN